MVRAAADLHDYDLAFGMRTGELRDELLAGQAFRLPAPAVRVEGMYLEHVLRQIDGVNQLRP